VAPLLVVEGEAGIARGAEAEETAAERHVPFPDERTRRRIRPWIAERLSRVMESLGVHKLVTQRQLHEVRIDFVERALQPGQDLVAVRNRVGKGRERQPPARRMRHRRGVVELIGVRQNRRALN
jgi:hypothetical protein